MSDNSRVRVSIVGIVVVALFSTLLVRLWFLQSGPEDSLKVQAVVDSTRVIHTETPRGEIKDRNGVVLVRDRASWAVTIDRDLTKRSRDKVIGQLAELLHAKVGDLVSRYESDRQSLLEPAIVALDVSQPDRLEILQDPQNYPGVHVKALTVREYPQGDLGAQVLGYVGEVPSSDLSRLKKLHYESGDQIGLAGAEAAFESELRGQPRRETIEVDPTGKQVGGPVKVDEGKVGNTVYLTIDAQVQRASEKALAEGILGARGLQNIDVKTRYATYAAPAGAVVVLDAKDGSVVALASNPTYPLQDWVGGISRTNYAAITNPLSNFPLVNRATQGLYAPGSTFKLVSSLAMTNDRIRGIGDYYTDQGKVTIRGSTFHNAKDEQFGPVNLQQALTVSSDAYFYTVGDEFWNVWNSGDHTRGLGIQREARDLGFGAPTGIELDEAGGRVPDPAWKSAYAHANYKTKKEQADNSVWYPGDNILSAVGQGDVVATPLQLANAYAAFANGGTLWHPRIEDRVVDANGDLVMQTKAKAIRHLTLDSTVSATIMAGLQGSVDLPNGTANAAFQGFPFAAVPIAGKTGTAQVAGKGDTSLFAAIFAANGTQYVAVAVVEQAGFGAQTAAPIVRNIIESMTGQHPGPVQVIKSGHD
ncbi:MAG: penicillin-binding protein 2 [Actinomycetota bacterium]|nr:penicillin-binding protein 2 [Actinomycetota bacterium]